MLQILRYISLFVLTLALPRLISAQEAGERKVRMKDLPPAVQRAVQEQAKGASLRGLSQETEQGSVRYEAELRIGGRTRDVTFDAAGSVLMVEEEVEPASLPPAVLKAIETKAGKGRILLVESITEGGRLVSYEAHLRIGGKESEFKVDPQGNPLLESR